MTITLRNIVQTCGACPSQWEGNTEDGRVVYVRYRWGYLSMGVGETINDAVDDETFGERVGDEFDGVMDTAEMLTRVGLVLAASKRRNT